MMLPLIDGEIEIERDDLGTLTNADQRCCRHAVLPDEVREQMPEELQHLPAGRYVLGSLSNLRLEIPLDLVALRAA